MKWEKVKLGDVVDSCLGKMLDQNKNTGLYKPYLANLNVRWGEFDLDNLPMMKFEDKDDERYGLRYGDIMICEGGEPGRCAIWKSQIPDMKFQKALHRVRVKPSMDYRYLYYWFLLAGKTKVLDQYFTGSTIKHLPAIKLKEIKIDKPPLSTQQKIGNILSTYDDLIENNQKQIKLLEEAAQRLYKEWFVDLRFPGHENVKIVDGVPEGWSKTVLGALAPFRRGTTITKSKLIKGKVPVIAGGLKPAYFHNKANTVAPVITVSASGANAGHTMYHNRNVFASDCSFIDASITEKICYIYCFLKHYNQTIRNLQKGSAQPHVYAKDLNELSIFMPDKWILDKFVEYANCIFDKIESLRKCVESLQEARDHLLPKLISGEIEL